MAESNRPGRRRPDSRGPQSSSPRGSRKPSNARGSAKKSPPGAAGKGGSGSRKYKKKTRHTPADPTAQAGPNLARRGQGGETPTPLTDANRGERLQKVMADAGVASRRASEALIAEGRVTVNDQVVTALPAWVDPFHDRVEVDGQPITKPRRTGKQDHVYVILHKPRHVISTTDDPEDRRTVTDLVDLPREVAKRLYPVGRLDAESTGLILLTNDGELANRLTHPSFEVDKRYEVSIRGRLEPDDIERLKKGLFLAHPTAGRSGASREADAKAHEQAARHANDAPAPGSGLAGDEGDASSKRPDVKVRRASVENIKLLGYHQDRTRGDRTQLLITLKEGQNREIRRLIARLGYKVRRLKRVAIGPITLKGLGPGQWRMLESKEVNVLRKATQH